MTVAARAAKPVPALRRTLRGRPWPTLVVVGFGVMMADLDLTVVAVANPVIQRGMHASLAQVEWITNGCLLAVALSLIAAGRLGDRFGHRQTFLLGVAGFAAASAGVGLSADVTSVIVCRVLQGLSAALLMPAALATLRASFRPDRLSTALGVYGMVIGASTAAGPVVGGLLVEHAGWRSVFFINVPVGILVLAAGLFVLRDHRPERAFRLDLPGLVLLSGALLCVMWPLVEAGGRAAGGSSSFLAGAAALFTVFVVREHRTREPLIPLRMFRSLRLDAGLVLVLLLALAYLGGLFVVTFYLQNMHGLSPAQAGLRLLPLTGVLIVASPLAGVLIGKAGPRMPVMCGMLLTSVAMLGLSGLTADAPAATTSVWLSLLGLGLAPVMVGSLDVVVGSAAPELSGLAAGLHQTAVQTGGSLGTAVFGALMMARARQEVPHRWASAGLPPLPDRRLDAYADAVSVGIAPIPPGTPAPAAEKITSVAHGAFLSATHLTFSVACGISLTAALVAALIGRKTPSPVPEQPVE